MNMILMRVTLILGGILGATQYLQQAHAQPVPTGAREVPARTIPVPDTVSPQMQAIIARPISLRSSDVPKTVDEWKAIVEKVMLGTMEVPFIR